VTDSPSADLARLAELIREIGIALLTTVDEQGLLSTRPVQTMEYESEGVLWFFTDWHSPKANELRQDRRVSLGYANPARHTYVAVSGLASVVRDPARARRLWSPEQRAFYPEGPEDARLALLKVKIEQAEYWIAPGPSAYLFAAAKAAVTGTPAGTLGENRKL